MRLRWLLPPLAALFLGGAYWIGSHGRGITAESLLAEARAKLAQEPPDRVAASRAYDEALTLARRPEQAGLRATLLAERSRLLVALGFPELALADCRTRLTELGADADTLARASDLSLWLDEPSLALGFAQELVALDPLRGETRIGRARVALADAPLAALESLARHSLAPSSALEARALAQRAAVFADDEHLSSASIDGLLELFERPDERRRAEEWVREAAEHMRAARAAFVTSLAPGTTNEAVAGLQDLLLRAGALREAADLGTIGLSILKNPDPTPVLSRTASALVELGRKDRARALILEVEARGPAAIQPGSLPSLALRDELEEWCLLLESLEIWSQLRPAALELLRRNPNATAANQLALFLAAESDLRENQLAQAQRRLEGIGANPVSEHELAVRVPLARAEVARLQGQRNPERYALLQASKAAPLDVPPPLRARLGGAWERLSELQTQAANSLGAEIAMTHALRLLPERAAELEPIWEELGRKSLGSRGVGSPFVRYTRARSALERKQPADALPEARALLAEYPGLGPALEIAARAAQELRDYPRLIEVSLQQLERGWPPGAASARLRLVPMEYFLPKDRVRWLQLDPRGSLEAVVRRLMEKDDLQGAALAARGGPAKYQPPEILPLLAKVELQAGFPGVATETLGLLPPESAEFRSHVGLALHALLASGLAADPRPTVERVLASGAAEDPELCGALDRLLAVGHGTECAALLAWLEPQAPPFLGEVLLRQSTARLTRGEARSPDDDLERAASLLDDGRVELGRLVLALELGEAGGVEREAAELLATPFATTPARRAALALLAGDRPRAAEALASQRFDGRDALLELAGACLAALEPGRASASPAPTPKEEPSTGANEGSPPPETMPETAPEATPGPPRLAAELVERVGIPRLLVAGLAGEVSPWCGWALARAVPLGGDTPPDPWILALRARAWLRVDEPERARAELAPTNDPDQDPRLAWLRARALHALGLEERARTAEFAWLARSGESGSTEPELALMGASSALARDERDEARRLLEAALEPSPDDARLLLRLAEVEDTPGRRTRSIELYARLLSGASEGPDDPRVLAFLDVLRKARDEGEISEARWSTEIEALETLRPMDPAPTRVLAERSFQQVTGGAEQGRAHALLRFKRFQQRSLGRPLESLRRGEGERWIALLARYTPERAVEIAEAELRRDPSDPALWRASALALLAAGRTQSALERLGALQRVAPELETARFLAVTDYQLGNDRERFVERLASIERFDPQAKLDPALAFYGALVGAVGRPLGSIFEAFEMWRTRDENGLASPEHGRALALALFERGHRDPAFQVLEDTYALARNALERDVLAALGYLMRASPGQRAGRAPPPRSTASADDAPASQGTAPQAPVDDAPAGKPTVDAQGAARKTQGAADGVKKEKRADGEGGARPARAAKEGAPPRGPAGPKGKKAKAGEGTPATEGAKPAGEDAPPRQKAGGDGRAKKAAAGERSS